MHKIKSKIDDLYGFDVLIKRRYRKYAFAKKVLTTMLLNYGYKITDIVQLFKISHDRVLYNKKTMSTINKIDVFVYNKTIEELDLDLEKILTVKSLSENPVVDEIAYKMKSMTRKDLNYFKSNVFEPFLEKIKFEEKIKNL